MPEMSTPSKASSQNEEDDIEKHAHMKLVRSPLRFANTIKKLSAEHKVAVQEIGLGGLVHTKAIYLRRLMLVKVAKRYDMKTQTFASVVSKFL
jgi:hypothetical protein